MAEHNYVGVRCGIMDQFAVGFGKKDHAINLNCDTLEYKYAPLNLGNRKLVITNTNKRRGLTDSKYNERRAQCDRVVEQPVWRWPRWSRMLAHVSCNPYRSFVRPICCRLEVRNWPGPGGHERQLRGYRT